MDRNFYHQHQARERQKEVSQELANRHLRDSIKHEPITRKQARNMVIRLVPAVLFMAALLLAALGW